MSPRSRASAVGSAGEGGALRGHRPPRRARRALRRGGRAAVAGPQPASRAQAPPAPLFGRSLSSQVYIKRVLLFHWLGLKSVAPPDRQFSVWLGGAILASVNASQQLCAGAIRMQVGPSAWVWLTSAGTWSPRVTKQDYDEAGPVVIHRKSLG